jgi:hypothetical protein
VRAISREMWRCRLGILSMELVIWSNGDVEGADGFNFFEKMLY